MALLPPATVADFKVQFDRAFSYGKGTDKIRDTDIQLALNQAMLAFNPALWTKDEIKIAFLYLAAHEIVGIVQAAGGLSAKNHGLGVNAQGEGVVQSKGVGSVNVAYVWPEMVTNSPFLSQFLTTQFGQTYLKMLTPRLVGHVKTVEGEVDPGVGIPNIPFISSNG